MTNINQTITYKAWDIRKKKMVPKGLVIAGIRGLAMVSKEFHDPFSFFDGCIWLMQTPFKDIEGIDIYEGDITEGESSFDHQVIRGTVIFEEKRGRWAWKDIDGYNDADITELCWLVRDNKLKIIGNIYENDVKALKTTNNEYKEETSEEIS